VSQGLLSGSATQKPAAVPRKPQPHFEGVPARTSADDWQLISLVLFAQVSQWKKSMFPSLPATGFPFASGW
jgi:hypothetical protein